MTIHRGPRSGYSHYWLAFGVVLAFVVATLATDYYGI
jgi:hypothetical protein